MENKDFIQNYLSEVTKVAQAIPVADIDKAIELLNTKDWISSVTKEDELIIVNAPVERAAEISELLVKNDVFISEMKTKGESLESFFLELTEEQTVA